jgi:hypothetical protein
MEYKTTLNMNKSGFPMRAGLPKREPDMLAKWNELDVYKELLKKNSGKPLFSLHDGPPFSNGDIHMGHALNKASRTSSPAPTPCAATTRRTSPAGTTTACPSSPPSSSRTSSTARP